jgi:RNA polymerase sigma-70 factor (ECF subfamily)
MRQLLAGDEQAFHALVERYKLRLAGYIYHRIGDAHRTEDLTQEVFLRAFRAAQAGASFAGSSRSLGPWLFTVARNCVTDYLRAKQRRPLILAGDGKGALLDGEAPRGRGSDPASAAMHRESSERVAKLLQALPDEQREAIAMKVFAGLTFAEVADVAQQPIATIKSRVRYGLIKLQAMLMTGGEA